MQLTIVSIIPVCPCIRAVLPMHWRKFSSLQVPFNTTVLNSSCGFVPVHTLAYISSNKHVTYLAARHMHVALLRLPVVIPDVAITSVILVSLCKASNALS